MNLPHSILDGMYDDIHFDLKSGLAQRLVSLLSCAEIPRKKMTELVVQHFQDIFEICRLTHLTWARRQPDLVAYEDKNLESSAKFLNALNTLSMADALTFVYGAESKVTGDLNPTDIKSWGFLESNYAALCRFPSLKEPYYDGIQLAAASMLHRGYVIKDAMAENANSTIRALV